MWSSSAKYCASAGITFTTVCPPGEWLPGQLRGAGVPVEEVVMRGRESCKLPRLLPQMARSHNIDLIHSHLTRATYFASYTGRMTRIPVVSSVHVMTRDFCIPPPVSQTGQPYHYRFRIPARSAAASGRSRSARLHHPQRHQFLFPLPIPPGRSHRPFRMERAAGRGTHWPVLPAWKSSRGRLC